MWADYARQRPLPRLFGFVSTLTRLWGRCIISIPCGIQDSCQFWLAPRLMLIVHKINALEPAVKPAELLLGEFITREAEAAAEVKRDKPILVVLGNPPYSGHSANRSYVAVQETVGGRTRTRKQPTWIGERIEDYKQVDGQPLRERQQKWLQDDYVKFIRFAEWRIEQTGQGVVAFITNHAYLTGNRNQKGTALYIPKLGVQYRLSLNVEGGCTQCGMSHRISE
jgi:hypothetical protein